MARRKIKHNDLTAWFLEDHATLPASYVKSCQEFFDELKENQNRHVLIAGAVKKRQEIFDKIKQTPKAPYKNFYWPTIPKRQAASDKPQAPSSKLDKQTNEG